MENNKIRRGDVKIKTCPPGGTRTASPGFHQKMHYYLQTGKIVFFQSHAEEHQDVSFMRPPRPQPLIIYGEKK
jgi:hypothetical protein